VKLASQELVCSLIENLAHNSALYGNVPLLMPDHRSTEQAAYYASTEPKRRQPPPEKKRRSCEKFGLDP
jgi:hypothetical protein